MCTWTCMYLHMYVDVYVREVERKISARNLSRKRRTYTWTKELLNLVYSPLESLLNRDPYDNLEIISFIFKLSIYEERYMRLFDIKRSGLTWRNRKTFFWLNLFHKIHFWLGNRLLISFLMNISITRWVEKRD